MKHIRLVAITTLFIASLLFFSKEAFANHTSQIPGWGDPRLAQLGPGGNSVNPIGEVIREETDVLQDSIRQAISTGGNISNSIQTAVSRFLQNVFAAIGMV
jgi:hypothetical protein